jgi:hypothetical protein
LQELKYNEYERVRPLFRKMDMHLPLQAILAGNVNAPIFVDSAMNPSCCISSGITRGIFGFKLIATPILLLSVSPTYYAAFGAS